MHQIFHLQLQLNDKSRLHNSDYLRYFICNCRSRFHTSHYLQYLQIINHLKHPSTEDFHDTRLPIFSDYRFPRKPIQWECSHKSSNVRSSLKATPQPNPHVPTPSHQRNVHSSVGVWAARAVPECPPASPHCTPNAPSTGCCP